MAEEIKVYLRESPSVQFSEEKVPIRGFNRNIASFVPKQDIKGIVLISHGLHEHSLRYGPFAYDLAEKNYAVYAIDHYAHGLSDGKKGLIDNYKILVQDFVEFAKYVQSKHPDKPTFIFAHSCGTLVVILAVPDIKNVQAVILSGAPLVVGPDSGSPFGVTCLYPLSKTSFAKGLTSCMSSLDPKGPVAPIAIRGITSDPEEAKIHGKDPRMFHNWIMNKTAFEVLKMTEEVKSQGLARFSLPVFVVHGGNDSVALPVGSEFVYANIKTEPTQKSIKIFDSLRHEMLHEKQPQRSECAALFVNYFEEQFALLTKP